VGELLYWRGNKVFQVVTPARQGAAGFIAKFSASERRFYR
jgi:hypothetical protein